VPGGVSQPEVVEQLRHTAPRASGRKIAVRNRAQMDPVDRAEVLNRARARSREVVAARAQEARLSISPDVFYKIKRTEALPALLIILQELADKAGIGLTC